MVTAVSREFRLQMDGYGLTTAEIHYHMPDYPNLLQLYVWQEYDRAPDFPELKGFLGYWESELDGELHSVRVAHHRLITPSEWRAVNGIVAIH
ncbi:protein usg [Mesorhizobium sp. B2-4-4]|uniref:usg protein n=1 Tax=Mesorhizobium sp. B2-4-4 TaxID=2589945 RepID=UPI0011279115|nr:usg protein [Mesorhizobium sp. B2-4-4]TPL47015.1 protein usg [Mesorhizobium sp. B2-4-4]